LGTGTGLPLEEQEAVPVQMPTADGDVAMSYETVVSGKLALARRYPPEADASGAHGAAMIAFLIDDKGHVVKLKLLKSSGDAALDVESLALVMRAEPFPPPPPGAEREFSITVDFERGK
jgi:colicin import membrane protein